MLVILLVYVFLPDSQTPAEENEVQSVSIDFLDVDPKIADSIISNIDDQELVLQHVIWKIPADSNFELNGIRGGGFILDGNREFIAKSISLLDSTNAIQPYYYVNPARQFLNSKGSMNQDLLNISSKKVLKAIFKLQINSLLKDKITGFILDYNSEGFGLEFDALQDEQPELFRQYDQLIDTSRKSYGLIGLHLENDLFQDSSYFKKHLSRMIKRGVPLLISKEDSISKEIDLREQLKNLQFNGLIAIESSSTISIDPLVKQGADLIILDYHPDTYKKLIDELKMVSIGKEKYSFSIKRNLLAKTWMKNGLEKIDHETEDSFKTNNQKRELKALQYAISKNSIVLVNNEIFGISNISKGFDIYATEKFSRFQRTINQYSGFHPVTFDYSNAKLLKTLSKTKKKSILILNDILLDTCKQNLKSVIEKACANKNVITVLIGNPKNIITLNQAQNLIYASNFMDKNQYILAKQICGVTSFKGKLAFYHEKLGKETGESVSRTRMGKGIAEEVGMNPDTLAQIDYLVKRALSGRAFPGCQVLVAKEGQIIYDKNFGYQTYKRENKISDRAVYDIASLTKVVATTMVAMKLYEMKAYNLNDSLYQYLPEDTLRDHLNRKKSSIRNIRFDEILVHKSGLPAGAPIIQYLKYVDRQKEIGRYDKYYCDEKDDTIFCVEIAKDYYLDGSYLDSMWLKMNSLQVNKSKSYNYSDVNMNLLYRMFKSIIERKNIVQKPKRENYDVFSIFLDSCFYHPLEMKRTTYLPRVKYDTMDIVPTENDKWWRKQLLRGYVHDPNAALYGGVAGNAGIFSNKTDLVKLFQMLLDGGTFEGKRYLEKETIELFTQAYGKSHRGLGFNKQSASKKTFGISPLAPASLFGHTGFTGTCVWADPENDIILIFLSNRVHPKVNKRIYKFGVRKNIHDFIYRSLMGI